MSRVAIIGGGVIGLFTAYYLRKRGHDITIFDPAKPEEGCSYGNAGMIVPSHIIPLASPGMIAKGVRWMFNSQSPFYIKPRFNAGLLKWGYQFYKHANHQHVTKAIPALKEISLYSKSLYQEFAKDVSFDFGFRQCGLLMLYKSSETQEEEIETAHLAQRNGMDAHMLSQKEIQDLQPDVKVSVLGGVFFPGDAHLSPHLLIQNLSHLLVSAGVLIKKETVIDFSFQQDTINAIVTENETQSFEQVVLCAGSWSSVLCTKLGLELLLQGGKGYSLTIRDLEKNISIPSILLESRVAITPMETSLRVGGTMEINGMNRDINMKRVQGIVKSLPDYFPDITPPVPSVSEVWNGLRPCSPDGLPYIGRIDKYKNLLIATGHGMMGVSLGPATGKIVASIIENEKSEISISSFRPDRFA